MYEAGETLVLPAFLPPVYFEQFEPSDGTDALTYFNEVSSVLFDGLNALKAAGVEKVLVDNSGNRGKNCN